MMNPEEIEKELLTIKERNTRVEQDKKWENSWVRRGFIAGVIYVAAVVWLMLIEDTNFWLKAFVPVAGYIFSTLSLPPLKKWWTSATKN